MASKQSNGGGVPAPTNVKQVVRDYTAAKHRLILLDYDGTLVPIERLPEQAVPRNGLVEKLSKLADDASNTVFVISGRDRSFLLQHLDSTNVGMSVEHGIFFRLPVRGDVKQAGWSSVLDTAALRWKEQVVELCEGYKRREPSSVVEVKEVNVTWHYRTMEDQEKGESMAQEFAAEVAALNLPVDILIGKKNVEVRPKGVNKGTSVATLLDLYTKQGQTFDFVLCAGDDATDEEMFSCLAAYKPPFKSLHTVVIGTKTSGATGHFAEQKQMIELLDEMVQGSSPSTLD